MPTPLNTPVICPVLIGRGPALNALSSVLRRATEGTPRTANATGLYTQTVLVSGEAGIGKSRLVTETKALATELHAVVAQGNCFEPYRSVPYTPVLDLLRAMCAAQAADALPQWLGSAAPEIIKLLPELAAQLPDVVPTLPLEPAQERRRLFETLTRFLLECVSRAPLLLVIEDVHWCDDTTLELLLTLSRRAVTLRTPALVLVLTYRSDEVHPSLRHFLAELDRGRLAMEVALSPLSILEVEGMVRAIFEHFDVARPPRTDFLDALHTLTEGNPFFIEEILRALMLAGKSSSSAQAWQQTPVSSLRIPRSVHDTVQERLRQLSQAARELLVLAAVAGQHFDFALLHRLTARDDRELLPLIKELIAAQLVVERSAEQFAFRHALTRQAIYSELLARERKALHGDIARALEDLYAENLEPYLADLAYHAFEANAWEQALIYARRVGERSLTLYAPRAAIEHLSRALYAAAQLAMPPDATLFRARGLAHAISGAFDEARSDYEMALRRAEETGDRWLQWQALVDLGKLWAERDYIRTGDYVVRAHELARAMDTPAILAHSLNLLGNWRLNLDQPQEALRDHNEALAIFRQFDDARGTAATLDLLGMASLLNGDAPQGATYYHDAIPLLRTLDDQQLLSSTLASLAICGPSYQTEAMIAAPLSFPESIHVIEQAIALARATGWRAGETYALMTLACCLGYHGNTTDALHAALASLDIAHEIEHQQWEAAAHWVLGRIYLDVLALDVAHRNLEQGLSLARSIGSRHWINNLLGYLIPTLLTQGHYDQAAALLDELLLPDTPIQSMGQRSAWCGRAALDLAQGRPEAALHTAERIVAATPRSTGSPDILLVTMLSGRALLALRRFEEATDALEAARALAESQGARSHLWRVDADLCALWAARGCPDAAEHARAAARATIEELAAALSDATLRAGFLSQALDLVSQRTLLTAPSAPPTPRAATSMPGGLTAREREVARLVAQGKSNRRIAAELVVSERTVESHVTNILGKLGFTSRTQIAVWSTGHQPRE